jgi:hypothetical protein
MRRHFKGERMKKACFMLGVLLLSGCIPIGIYRMGEAQKEQASVAQKQAYDEYVLGIERLNLDREKAGLADKPIKSYEEWRGELKGVHPTEDKPKNQPTSNPYKLPESGPPRGW